MKTRLLRLQLRMEQNERAKAGWAASRGSTLRNVVRSEKSGGRAFNNEEPAIHREVVPEAHRGAMEMKGLKVHRGPPPSPI